jgi:hypothetical protein
MFTRSDGELAEAAQDVKMVDDLGFLQGIWITQHHPDLREIMSSVESPDLITLRRAGMTKVRLVQSVGLGLNT